MKLAFGIVALLAVIAGGFALFFHVRDLNTAIVVTKRDLAATSRRLAQIEEELERLRAAQTQSAGTLAQQPRPLAVMGVLQVHPAEAEIIRDVILNQPGVGPDMTAVVTIGETLQDVSPRPVPIELVSRMPKLKGLRYLLDSRWAIALIAPATNRVIAVISPV